VRQLSARQAAACENATTPRCKCRCGGAAHGAARVTIDELGLLAADDPHRAGAPAPVQLTLGTVTVVLPDDPDAAELARQAAARAGVDEWLAIGQLRPVEGWDGDTLTFRLWGPHSA